MNRYTVSIYYILTLSINLLLSTISESSEFPYFDLNATSPNGTYKATVKYDPVYHDGPPVITLFENNQIAWSKIDPPELNAPPPTKIFPTDDGSIFSCGIDEYYMFNKLGNYKYIFDLKSSVIRRSEKKYCSYSMSIGTFCHKYSKNFFIEFNDTTYICIVLYWGRFFVIDTHSAKITTQSEILTAVENTIINKTLDDIREIKENIDESGKLRRFKKRLIPAVFISAKYNIPEGEKLIIDFIENGNYFYVKNLCDSLPQNRSYSKKCRIRAKKED